MRKSKVHELTAEQYKYFDKWFNVAIRELLNFYPFRGDYGELAKMLQPPITPHEARTSVALLLKLGLIEEKDDHTFFVTNKSITTYPYIPLIAVHNFQLETMKLVQESIDRFFRNERSISTITLSVSTETYKKLEDKLAHFRREMQDIIENDRHIVDRVYQFNFQIFPLSNTWRFQKV